MNVIEEVLDLMGVFLVIQEIKIMLINKMIGNVKIDFFCILEYLKFKDTFFYNTEYEFIMLKKQHISVVIFMRLRIFAPY